MSSDVIYIFFSGDNAAPVINCPGPQFRNADINSLGVNVNFTEPKATDNSGTAILINQSAQPDDTFKIGATSVTYTFEDPTGNTASCTFQVVVTGRE